MIKPLSYPDILLSLPVDETLTTFLARAKLVLPEGFALVDDTECTKVMPLEAIPRHIGLAAVDIAALAGLPEGYFQGKTNVVEFARLKATQKPSDDHPEHGNKVVQFRAPIQILM